MRACYTEFKKRGQKETGKINMKKLLVYLKDYKVESIVGPLFKLLEACFELIVPLLVAEVITRPSPQAMRRPCGAPP